MKKRILFIYNSYNEYQDKIIESLRQYDDDLTVFSLTPTMNRLESLVDYFTNEKYFQKKTERIEDKFFSNLYYFDYDYVFVLTGRRLKNEILKYLKKKCKKAKFILYLWDDIARVDGMIDNLHFFDKVFSFDSKDCKKYGFNFLPLFYSNVFTSFKLDKIYDLFYCGVIHVGRFELLKNIVSFSEENNLNLKSALLISSLGYYKRYLLDSSFRKKYSKHCINRALSLNDFAKYLNESKATIDMPIKSQTGLPMRCIEALAAQAKIITTNEHIKEYDFYCPENVMIIDRENPVFDVDFIKSPYKPIPKEIVEKYSLENWIRTIFKE